MNSLLDQLFGLDLWLLMKINHDWSNSFFDILFPIITELHHMPFFAPVVLPIFIILALWKMRETGMILIATLFVGLGMNDFVCGKIIKPFVGRIRPSSAGMDVIVRAPVFGDLSFPSNHAANMFCAATILSAYFPRGKYYFYFFASLVAYSRSYVGVHYPLDWIGGAIIGFVLGKTALFSKDLILKKLKLRQLQ